MTSKIDRIMINLLRILFGGKKCRTKSRKYLQEFPVASEPATTGSENIVLIKRASGRSGKERRPSSSCHIYLTMQAILVVLEPSRLQ